MLEVEEETYERGKKKKKKERKRDVKGVYSKCFKFYISTAI